MLRNEFSKAFRDRVDEFVMEELWGGEDYQIDLIDESHPLYEDEIIFPVTLYIYSFPNMDLAEWFITGCKELDVLTDGVQESDDLYIVQYSSFDSCYFESRKEVLGVFKTQQEADIYAKKYKEELLNYVDFIEKVKYEYEHRADEKFENQLELHRQQGYGFYI